MMDKILQKRQWRPVRRDTRRQRWEDRGGRRENGASMERDLDEGSFHRSNLQDVPIWMLALIIVAISGILIVLVLGSICLLRTYLNHRSRIDKIMTVLDSVITDNREFKEERKSHFVPSKDVLEGMMDEILQEESSDME